jgi:SAM-dependent methyltransferase
VKGILVINQFNDIDGTAYYKTNFDAQALFNGFEITLSHLFRNRMRVLSNRNYSECLFETLHRKGYLKPAVLEVGCGLGDLALNFLASDRREEAEVSRYILFDVSPALLDLQREKLAALASDFVLGDCFELAKHVPDFAGMVLANAIIADFRSTFVGGQNALACYGISDPDLEGFAAEWQSGGDGYYLHVGTALFLRELHRALKAGSTAAILDYAATPLNQPSVFFDPIKQATHVKCGIDFAQVSAYAARLGFAVEVISIEEILGIDPAQPFLTVDVYTNREKIMKENPAAIALWEARNDLPISAYTRESLYQTLCSDHMGFRAPQARQLLAALDPYFFTIHDPGFDTINPTTWGYQCLLLRKP